MLNILIVDDNDSDREICRRHLTEDGQFNVSEVQNGHDCLEYCKVNIPDCILLDYTLPDLDGLSVLRELSTTYGEGSVPIIMLTGRGDEQIARTALKSGAVDYVSKTAESFTALPRHIRMAIKGVNDLTQLMQSAERDNLTGVMSQPLFTAKLDEIIFHAKENKQNLTLLYVGLENIKELYDEHGHLIGDVILKEVSKRLKTHLKNNDMITRVGIGNFAIYLSDVNESSEIKSYCSKMFDLAMWPIQVKMGHHRVGLNIGVAIFDGSQPGTEELLEQAGRAMQYAKRLGKFGFQFYTPECERYISQSIGNDNKVNVKENVINEKNNIEDFLKLILDASPDFIFVKDQEFKVVHANSVFMSLYPKEMQDKVIGYTTCEQYPPEEVELFLRHDKIAFDTGKSETFEKIKFPDGETRTLFTKKVRFENKNGEAFILGIGRDVTERERFVAQLEENAAKVATINQELDDFVKIVSHDLKEPLRGIYNYASFLQEDYQDKLDKGGLQKLETLKCLAKKMERLLSELLSYSTLCQKHNNYDEVDLQAVLEGVIDTLQPAIEARGVEIKASRELPSAHCEKILVSALFSNLISNAAKYNDKKHKWIEVGYHKDLELGNVYYVKDNGIGIKKEHHNAIFKIFKRLHHEAHFESGTGFGLTIAKKVIAQHGGKIWVESTPDLGTTFYFTLGTGMK